MSDSYLARITPLGRDDEPPGIWGGMPSYPSHPIAPGGPPPGVSHPIPPGIWPPVGGGLPGSPSHPIVGYPDQGLPGGGVVGRPSHPIVIPPVPPTIGHPIPPDIWPGVPIHPETPEHPIELPPGAVWPPLPPAAGEDKVLVLVLVLGTGQLHWVVVDTSLEASHPIAPTPEPK